MSFLGGAECSTAGNALSQFTKHVQDDKSLQRDRLVGRGPGGSHEGMRTGGAVGWQDHAMDDFLQAPGQLPTTKPASPFAMEQMRRELEKFQGAPLRSHAGSPGWASEFHPHAADQARMEAAFQPPNDASAAFSPADLARYQQIGRNGMERTAANPASQASGSMSRMYQAPISMGHGGLSRGLGGMGMGMGRMGGQSGQSYSQTPSQQNQSVSEGKGKGRVTELDDEHWETQFAQVDAEETKQGNVDAEARVAMERELNDMDRSVDALPSETDVFGDFESIWRGIEAEGALGRDVTADDAWNEDFNLGRSDEQWMDFDSSIGTHNAFSRDPELGDYLFEEENLFRDLANPYDEGVRIMSEGGNLSLAALAFEAAVQKDPSHVPAWQSLGNAQAQNEKESPAIRALEQALKLDPANLPALMGLAVSYTNEGYDSTAYRTLERWLSIKYPSVSPPDSTTADAHLGFHDRATLHEKVTSLFIAAAQLSPSGAAMDPDVQVGLGVLFYGAEAYDKAVDCFSAALASTASGASNDAAQLHLLWNRLGATLANSGRSEEAIDAYERALTLRPNFVRARYNLGVSCINIGCYEEAAQHLLGALRMHDVVEREGRERVREIAGGVSDGELDNMVTMNQSTNLYDTLRRVFGQMGRRDLSESVVAGMDVESFRGEFDF